MKLWLGAGAKVVSYPVHYLPILAATSSGFLPVSLVEKSCFLVILLRKNRELYVNLTILAGFFAITRLKIIAATFRNMEKTRLDELYIYVDNNFLLK